MNRSKPNIGIIGLRGAWSSEALSTQLQRRGNGGDIIEWQQVGLDLQTGKSSVLSPYDGIIIKKMGKTYSPALQDQLDLLAHMESAGLPMFSSPKRLKTMISRLGCTLQLQSHDIPMPATFIGEDAGAAAEWVERKGPCVYKPLYSTKARGMEILKPGDALLESLKRIKVDSEQPLYLQQVLDLKGRDYGLVFLKGAFVGAYARVGDGSSWNTTTVNGGRYQAYDPPTEIIDLAQRAQAAFGLSFTSVDVAIGPDGPIVFEVSAFGGYRGLFEACGIDASELLVDHVLQSLGS